MEVHNVDVASDTVSEGRGGFKTGVKYMYSVHDTCMYIYIKRTEHTYMCNIVVHTCTVYM